MWCYGRYGGKYPGNGIFYHANDRIPVRCMWSACGMDIHSLYILQNSPGAVYFLSGYLDGNVSSAFRMLYHRVS